MDLAEEPVLLLWLVEREPAVAVVIAVATVLFDLTWLRLLNGGWVADCLVRVMFPEPPRPPACYGSSGINTGGVWVDKVKITHDDNPRAQLQFGFGRFSSERELELRHIAG